MRKLIILFAILLGYGCQEEFLTTYVVQSPSGKINLIFDVTDGQPSYTVTYLGDTLIMPSKLGFEFDNQTSLNDLIIKDIETDSVSLRYARPLGTDSINHDLHKSLTINLQERAHPYRHLILFFKLFDDGIGFRYRFPNMTHTDSLLITSELTEFNIARDMDAWWIPGDWDSYEHLYNRSKISDIDATTKRNHPNLGTTFIPENAVNTPITMIDDAGLHVCIHEAALVDFPGMTLRVDTAGHRFSSSLVGRQKDKIKAEVGLPFNTPWRTIQITKNASDLMTSNLILNLNEPNKIKNMSWIQPMKYTGIWLQMHIGTMSWDYGTGKHGATAKNAVRLIDFAAKHGIEGLLIEGWNTGWKDWFTGMAKDSIFDFVTPTPDYPIADIVAYANAKGVQLIMHHETAGAAMAYEQQLDTAFAMMDSLGISTIKTGYVGEILPKGEHHHGQWMVQHYQRVLEKAAEHQINLIVHEPIKPTGIRRTYPNLLAQEGLRGQEFNVWAKDGGNPPEHLTIVPFTRMIGGPIDYTPGIFNTRLQPWRPKNQVNTTLSHQLALYVILYSPVQMAPDFPQFYDRHPAFQFFKDVGVDWGKTIVLDAQIGDYVSVARQEKQTGNWFIGAITDENQRQMTLIFDFLEEEKDYQAIVYQDTHDAHYFYRPSAFQIDSIDVKKGDAINFQLAPGGGLAISIEPMLDSIYINMPK